MANIRIALGGEFDVASGNELDEMGRGIRDHISSATAKPKRILRPLSVAKTISITTGENARLSFGGPSTGRTWIVTRINCMADDDHTALANATAAVYIGNDNGLDITEGPALTLCVLTGQSIPFTTILNEHALVVHDRELLMVNVNVSNSVDANIVANALVWEYKDVDIETQYI